MTENFCFCLLCDVQSDDMSDVARHVADEHSQEQPFGVINSDGVLYTGEAKWNIINLLLVALEDELTRNKSPAKLVRVEDDLVTVTHVDDTTTCVDLSTFLDADEVRQFVLVNPLGIMLRRYDLSEAQTTPINLDVLTDHVRDWLKSNHALVFGRVVGRLELAGRLLENRSPMLLKDLLWTEGLGLMNDILPPKKPELPLPERASPEDWDSFFNWVFDKNNPEHDMTQQEMSNITGKAVSTINSALSTYEYRKMLRKYEALTSGKR